MTNSEVERRRRSDNVSFQQAQLVASQLLAAEAKGWNQAGLRLSTLFWARRSAGPGPRRAVGAFFVNKQEEIFEASVGTSDEPSALGEVGGSPLAEPLLVKNVNVPAVMRTLRRFSDFNPGSALLEAYVVSGHMPECFLQPRAALWGALSVTAGSARIVALNASTGALVFTSVLPKTAFGGRNVMFAMGWFKKLQLALIVMAFVIAFGTIALGGNPSAFLLVFTVIRIALFMISMLLEIPLIPPARRARLIAIKAKLRTARNAIRQSQKGGANGPTPQQAQDVKDALKELGGEIDSMKGAGEIDGDTADGMKSDLQKAQDGAEKLGK